MSRTKAASAEVEQLVGAGCARNAAAELLYEAGDGTVVCGRVRLLELTERQILADRPAYLDGKGRIPTGAPIRVHVSLGGSRHQFDSVIEEDSRLVRLNARQVIPGIALRRPTAITRSQRRAHLRVSVLGYDPISVDMTRPHPEIPDACPIDAQVISGWMVDLSVGGMSVVVDRGVLVSARAAERLFLSFVLPTVEDDFNMLGSVRHCRVVQRGRSLRLGIAFRPWQGPVFKRDQRRISRFVTEHERRTLRRRK